MLAHPHAPAAVPLPSEARAPASRPGTAPAAAADLQDALAALHLAAFGWALHCCDGDRDTAEETLQTTYLKVLTGAARFHRRSSLKTWLFAVVRRTASEQRRRQRLRRLGLALLATHSPPPQPSVEARLEGARLRSLLAQLSRRQGEILHLVFYQELTIEEAAAAAGLPLGTARTHYARGKVALRRMLGGEERR